MQPDITHVASNHMVHLAIRIAFSAGPSGIHVTAYFAGLITAYFAVTDSLNESLSLLRIGGFQGSSNTSVSSPTQWQLKAVIY